MRMDALQVGSRHIPGEMLAGAARVRSNTLTPSAKETKSFPNIFNRRVENQREMSARYRPVVGVELSADVPNGTYLYVQRES